MIHTHMDIIKCIYKAHFRGCHRLTHDKELFTLDIHNDHGQLVNIHL